MTSVITQNVKCAPEMRQSFVVDDVELTAEQADIICWQEIQIQRYVDAIEDLDPMLWDHYIDLKKGGAPISWRLDKYELIDAGSVVMYPLTPFISRTRKVVWVMLKHLRTGEVVVVLNCHFVAGAFSAKASPLRRALWNRCRRVLLKTVARFVNQGYACIIAGDINRHGFHLLGRFFELENGTRRVVQYPVPLDEIDQIILINGEELAFGKSRYAKLNGRHSDHQGNRVVAPLTKRKVK